MPNERIFFSKGNFIKRVANKHKELAEYLDVDQNKMKEALNKAKKSDSLESIFNNSNTNARNVFLDAVVGPGPANQAKRQEVENKLDEIWDSAEKAALKFDKNHSNGLEKSSNPKTDWFVFLLLLGRGRKFDKLVEEALKDNNNGPSSLLSFSSPTNGATPPTPTPGPTSTPAPAPGGALAAHEAKDGEKASDLESKKRKRNKEAHTAPSEDVMAGSVKRGNKLSRTLGTPPSAETAALAAK